LPRLFPQCETGQAPSLREFNWIKSEPALSHELTMNQKELKELIEFLIEKDIAEFELERGDVKVKIKRTVDAPTPVFFEPRPSGQAPAPVSAPPVPQHVDLAPMAAAPEPEEVLHIVRSPIVGTFYEAPSPGAPPFIKVGDMLEVGQVLCIVEAMKLMNEIECDAAGELVRKLVTNGQPIEYGQELFLLRPK
jgi:acetyl-CoA carboxylase biotin carboxyl carrier protein